MFLYTLRLQDKCWYVGTTRNLQARLQEHRRGKGSEWTREHAPIGFSTTYPPIKLEECDALCRLEEDKRVKQLMLAYDIDKVRGGSYARILLSRSDVMSLSKELYHAQNACLRCGRRGHWANVCRALHDIVGNVIAHECITGKKRPHQEDDDVSSDQEASSDQDESSDQDDELESNDVCYRCGRFGHWANQCYARRDVHGRKLA